MTQHDNSSSTPTDNQQTDQQSQSKVDQQTDQQSQSKVDQQTHQQSHEKKPTSYWKLFLYGMGGIVVIELIQALMR